MARQKLLDELSNAIVGGDVKKARRLTELLLNEGASAKVILETMQNAMRIVDDKYNRKEYFVIDVAAAASAMKEAFKLLQPNLRMEPRGMKAKIAIGSLKGNIQGLGKDIVAAALKSAGFEVIDLGVNVSPAEFVDAAVKTKAKVIAVSISMEETVPALKELIQLLTKRKLRRNIKVVIGGTAVSENTRRKYGIDAYASDAQDCVQKTEALLAEDQKVKEK